MPVFRLLLVLVSLLAVACGPSEETVACCECLAANEGVLFEAGCILTQGDEDALGTCLAEMEGGQVLVDSWCYLPSEDHSAPVCADACAASVENIQQGRTRQTE